MRRALRRPFLLLLLVLAGGTARAQDCPKPDLALQKAQAAQCRAAGGEWGRFGAIAHLCGIYSCAPRTTDGGKACRNRADCEFLCISRRPGAPGSPASGECAAVRTSFGCTTQVDDGRVAGTVCVE